MIYYFNEMFNDNSKPTVNNMTPDSASKLMDLMDSINKGYEKRKNVPKSIEFLVSIVNVFVKWPARCLSRIAIPPHTSSLANILLL